MDIFLWYSMNMKNGGSGLRRMIVWTGIICFMLSWGLCDTYADIYQHGLITVKHEEFTVTRDGHPIQYNHPYKLSEHSVARVLSSIVYREKGFLRRKDTLKVFHQEEIKEVTPLIVQAFSAATSSQVVTVSSYFRRFPLTDKHNYCIMFIVDHNLNIAFRHIHRISNL